MRKLVSALIVICAMAVNVNTFAAPIVGDLDSSRNSKTELVSDSSDKSSLPTFRVNDIIKFDVSGLQAGNQFTLISYKVNEEDLTDSSVQYINQYTLESATQPIEYKVRDISDGIYQITLNANNGEDDDIATFYYKVGTPKVDLICTDAANGKYYTKIQKNSDNTYSVAFVAKATIGTADVTFSEAGVDSLGLEVKLSENAEPIVQKFDDGKIDEIVKSFLETNKDNVEIAGSYTIYYGLTVYNIPSQDAAEAIIAAPVIYDTTTQATTEGGNAQ